LSKGRPGGAEAVSRTISAVGLDDTCQMQYQSEVVKEQGLVVLYHPSPVPISTVSGERVAPNRCSRIAKQRLIENDWAYGGALASKVTLLTRNRVISSVMLHPKPAPF